MNNRIRRIRIAENLRPVPLGAVTAGNAETPPHRSFLTTLLSPHPGLGVTRDRVALLLPNLVQTMGREQMRAKRVNNVANLRAMEDKERQATVRASQLLAKAIVKPMGNQQTSQGLLLLPPSRAMPCPRCSESSPT